MGKKTKATPAESTAPTSPEASAADKNAEKIAKEGRALKDMFHAGTPVPDAEGKVKKLAPQAEVIVNTIKAAGDAGIDRKTLLDRLSVPGIITTRQPIGRIVTYYEKPLIEAGHIVKSKAE